MWIVLETHGGAKYAAIITDTEGKNKVFDTEEEAQAEADVLQDGIIIYV